jgi:NAD(P)-dependent dehydrogenase (short-subunit alcohol dehydrogenase family)
MPGEYEGKVVLVTGGSYGIGRAAAIGFAKKGAKVAIADRVAGEETLRRVREAGGEAIFVKADVSLESEVEALVEKTVRAFGKLDCAFNNAGIHKQFVSTVDFTAADWDEMINTNLKSIWLCTKYEIPQMLKRTRGRSSVRHRRPDSLGRRAIRHTPPVSMEWLESPNRPHLNLRAGAYGLIASARGRQERA